jgi:hypothetical protein
MRYPATEGGTVKSSLDNFALRASDRQARSPERVHRTRTPVLSAGALARRPTANSRREMIAFGAETSGTKAFEVLRRFVLRPIDDPKMPDRDILGLVESARVDFFQSHHVCPSKTGGRSLSASYANSRLG